MITSHEFVVRSRCLRAVPGQKRRLPGQAGKFSRPDRGEARRAAGNELVDAAQHQLYDRIKRATQRENYPNYEKRPARV